MGLNLNDKKAVVAEVSAQVANAETIAIAEYRGIEVGDLTVLRKKARESGVYLRVLKNTLVRRAVEGSESSQRLRQDQRQVGSQGRFLCRQGARQGWCAGARVRPKPRRAALEAAVRHAGSGRRLCPWPRRPGQAARRSRRLILTAYELI